jgi:hypothetical protein
MIILSNSINLIGIGSFLLGFGEVNLKQTQVKTSLAFQKALNVISLVSINFIKHKKEAIQFYILLQYSLKMLNLHICASSE